MKSLSYFAAAAQQVAKHPVTVLKLEWKGGSAVAAGRYLQVHDAYATPANGAVPLKSYPIYADGEGFKSFAAGELQLSNGLYVCISSTEATKTLAADVFSMLSVELLAAEQPSGTSFAGDLTTDDEILQVWSEAAGASAPKRLYEIIATNNGGATYYLQIHAADTPSDEALIASFAFEDIETKRLSFGKAGRDIRRIVSEALKQGCTLAWSTEPDSYAAIGGNVGPIQAEYK